LRTGHATLTTDPTADPYPPHTKPELICSTLRTMIQLSHAHCTYRPALYILSSWWWMPSTSETCRAY